MTEQNTYGADDPWTNTARTLALPNVFHDTDGQPIHITAEAQSMHLRRGDTEIQLDPIEAQRLGDYLTKAGNDLEDKVMTEVFDDLRAEDAARRGQ